MKKAVKVSDAVYYRQYSSQVILFCTNNEQAYIFNDSTKNLLDFFNEYKLVEDYIDSLSAFGLTEDEEAELVEFIDALIKEGILVQETVMQEQDDDPLITFHRESLPQDQLYSAFFELTYRCNEKCQYCYCVEDKTQTELNTDEIKTILGDLARMNVLEVTFSGGDPFIRKDFFEILEYARSKRLLINIFTNGTAISDSDIIRLRSLNLKSIHFSIYSHIPEKHDAFTQVRGSFEKTVSVIKKCKTVGISVNIKTSILNCNIDDIEEIYKLGRSMGVSVQAGINVSVKNDGDNAPASFRLNDVEEYVRAIKIVDGNVDNICPKNTGEPHEQGGADYYICGAGRNVLSINPYGEVFPCNSLMISCGNIRQSSIIDIWEKSEKLECVRKWTMKMVKGCEQCKNKYFCGFCPGSAQLEMGDPLRKYDEACMIAEAFRIFNKKGES